MEKNRIIEEDAKDIASRVDLSELSGKEILITGASGLIGTLFVKRMHGKGPANKEGAYCMQKPTAGILTDFFNLSMDRVVARGFV